MQKLNSNTIQHSYINNKNEHGGKVSHLEVLIDKIIEDSKLEVNFKFKFKFTGSMLSTYQEINEGIEKLSKSECESLRQHIFKQGRANRSQFFSDRNNRPIIPWLISKLDKQITKRFKELSYPTSEPSYFQRIHSSSASLSSSQLSSGSSQSSMQNALYSSSASQNTESVRAGLNISGSGGRNQLSVEDDDEVVYFAANQSISFSSKVNVSGSGGRNQLSVEDDDVVVYHNPTRSLSLASSVGPQSHKQNALFTSGRQDGSQGGFASEDGAIFAAPQQPQGDQGNPDEGVPNGIYDNLESEEQDFLAASPQLNVERELSIHSSTLYGGKGYGRKESVASEEENLVMSTRASARYLNGNPFGLEDAAILYVGSEQLQSK